MEKIQLNLARKWRSQNFDQIVGQDLVVRILKNSLFLGKFFPVYLLAGQHGCGKTTTARVFAAAINCAALTDFQIDPKKNPVPCGACQSCCAMQSGKHPDFIEIDAASHTGVDNVRQLLETATLMSQMGRKKVYLIDEAHMLSKAAFNAFLKMLEEPNDHVLFILATTDEHKIIETVKSRCFQLFFRAVAPEILRDHLCFVCEQESIACDTSGLDLIVSESRGSVRDALNLLEQVFLSEQKIDKEHVQRVCGAAADDVIIKIFKVLLSAQTPLEFMTCLREISFERYNAEYIWRQLLEFLHVLLWTAHGVPSSSYGVPSELSDVIKNISVSQLLRMFNFWCEQEVIFVRTVNKTIYIQFFLLRAWHLLHADKFQSHAVHLQKEAPAKKIAEEKSVHQPTPETVAQPAAVNSKWSAFVQALEQLGEPLLVSIFKQARVIDVQTHVVQVQFAHRLVFLSDTIEQSKLRWLPLFTNHFGDACTLTYDFVAATQERVPVRKSFVQPARRPALSVGGGGLDVSDKDRWPLTHELLKQFPGTVTVVRETQKTENNSIQEVPDEPIHE